MTTNHFVAFALLSLLVGSAGASDYVWKTNGDSGYALDPAMWLVNGAATETAPVAGTDVLKIEGTSATMTGGAPGEAANASVIMPKVQVMADSELTIDIGAGKTFEFGNRNPNVFGNARLNLVSGRMTTQNSALSLSQGQSEAYHPEVHVTGSGTSYSSQRSTPGQHVNNNIQFWDGWPTFIVENGASMDDSQFISWAKTAQVIVRDAGTTLTGTYFELDNNDQAKTNEVWIGDGATLSGGNVTVGRAGRIVLDGAVLTGNPVLRATRGSAVIDLVSGPGGAGRTFVCGTDSAFYATNGVTATLSSLNIDDQFASTNVHALISNGSKLLFSGGESVIGRVKGSLGQICRIEGEGTEVDFEWTGGNMHENSSVLCVGYNIPGSTAEPPAEGPVGSTFEVVDGAVVRIVKSETSAANANNNGLVIGKASNCIGGRFLVGSGAFVTNFFYTYIGGSHSSWGGGSCGELVVSNGTFHAGNEIRINWGSNFETRASTNNAVRVIDGGVLDAFSSTIFVNPGNWCGGAKIVASNGTIRAGSLRTNVSKSSEYGWTEIEIGGTNGTIQVGHLADVTSNVLYRISIPAEGRTCPAIDCSNSGYFILNRSQDQLLGQRVKLDIDPTWSRSGRQNYADLFFNNPQKHPGLVPEDEVQLKYFMEHCFDSADLINNCRLELLPNAGGIRLIAGTDPGTMVLFR